MICYPFKALNENNSFEMMFMNISCVHLLVAANLLLYEIINFTYVYIDNWVDLLYIKWEIINDIILDLESSG